MDDAEEGYFDRAAAKVANLIPEVVALIDAGKLHRYDGEWIGGLPPGEQLAAALRHVKGHARPVRMDYEYRSERTRLANRGRRHRRELAGVC